VKSVHACTLYKHSYLVYNFLI